MDITVSEYADKHGKSVHAVRDLIKRGRLSARRSGKIWLLDSDTPYPADARMKSGKYVGWRNRPATANIERNKEL